MPKSALIQPRTSLGKSDVSWPCPSSFALGHRPGSGSALRFYIRFEARGDLFITSIVSLARTTPHCPETLAEAFFTPSSLCAAPWPARSGGHDTSPFPRLVLGCINADFRVQIRIFSIFQNLQENYVLASKCCKFLQT